MQTYSHLKKKIKKKNPVVPYFGEGMLPHISPKFSTCFVTHLAKSTLWLIPTFGAT
jgi:hypothetical protein